MKRLLHSLLSALIHGAARMPWPVLYAVADALYFILCRIARYRRKAVEKNLAESFPEMTEKERRNIRNQFYRNFADYIVETIKLLHVSDAEMRQRMAFENVEAVDELLAQGKSITAYFSHCFNWEWAPSITLWSRFNPAEPQIAPGEKQPAFCQVYRPLRDKWFDALMLKARSRFRSVSIPKTRTLRHLIELRRQGIASITGFMSDQKPSHGDPAHVIKFLNHPTAMITGTETLARRLEMAAIYFDMEKLGRSKYKITVRPIAADASQLPPMALTDAYAKLLETTIRRNPAIWLWSHKRWKNPVSYPNE